MRVEFVPCPLCGGKLKVYMTDFVRCKKCKEIIGYYIANAGAVKLLPRIAELKKSGSRVRDLEQED